MGEARVEKGEVAERYRAIHLKNNPRGTVFINGNNIDIITVRILEATICNSEDQVEWWTVDEGSICK
eukprot:CFRG0202T1